MNQGLVTKRLRIEALNKKHAKIVFEALQNKEIYKFIPGDPPTRKDLEKRYAFLEKGLSPDGEEFWLNWVAFLSGTNTPVGSFQATLPKNKEGFFAYIIYPEFWRQGYATEIAKFLISHIFKNYQKSGLFAEIDTRNIASIKLAESLGMKLESTKKNADFF